MLNENQRRDLWVAVIGAVLSFALGASFGLAVGSIVWGH